MTYDDGNPSLSAPVFDHLLRGIFPLEHTQHTDTKARYLDARASAEADVDEEADDESRPEVLKFVGLTLLSVVVICNDISQTTKHDNDGRRSQQNSNALLLHVTETLSTKTAFNMSHLAHRQQTQQLPAPPLLSDCRQGIKLQSHNQLQLTRWVAFVVKPSFAQECSR